MVISLADARAAALRKAGLQEVRKARRALQLLNHQDKGGNIELCQLINMAADKLEEMLDFGRAERRRQQNVEEERRAREEKRRAREARERAEAEERWQREWEEGCRRVQERRTELN